MERSSTDAASDTWFPNRPRGWNVLRVFRHWQMKSISFRITMLACTLVVVTLGFFAIAMIPLQRLMVEERMTTEARDISTSISQVTASALVTEDYHFIVEHCMSLVKESKSILYIAIVRKNGFVLVHTIDGWKQVPLTADWTAMNEQDTTSGRVVSSTLVHRRVFRRISPFLYSGIEWGEIHIGLSLEKYDADMDRIYVRTILLGVLCSIVGFVIAFAYGRRLSRPIRQLEQSTRQITAGDLTHRVQIASNDEIGRLAEAFNTMTAEWHRSHTALMQSQRLTSNIVRSLNDMLIVADVDGGIRMVNAATQERLGYAEHELLGHPLSSVLDAMTGSSPTPAALPLIEQRGEHVFRTKNGTVIPVLFSLTLLKDFGQQVDGLLCVAVDITERKEYELELQRGRDRLERRVEERTSELATANLSLQHEVEQHQKAQSKLETSLREKEVLIKEVHHRVKNNLQVITSLLNMQASVIEDPGAKEAIEESMHRVRSMAMIHERLYQADDLAHIDFSEYASGLTSFLHRSYGQLGERVGLSLQTAPIFLDVDIAIPCGLIINELISNALKYAFPGNRRGTINLRIWESNGTMHLSVNDDGIGLPEDFQFEDSQTLGLRLVKILTTQMHASLDVSGSPGASFVFSIPRRSR
jgi:PAS domain S-box-containing protein